MLEDPGRQMAHRVLAEIGGDVGQPDLVVAVLFALPDRLGRRQTHGGAVDGGTEQVLLGHIGNSHQGQGLANPLPRPETAPDQVRNLRKPVPFADVQVGETELAEQEFALRVERQELLETDDRLVVPLELGKEYPPVGQRLLVQRVDRQQPIEILHRLDVPVQLLQHRAAVDERLGVDRVHAEGPVETLQRLIASLQGGKNRPPVVPGGRVLRVDRHHPVGVLERLLRVAASESNHRQRIHRHEFRGDRGQHLQEQRACLFEPVGILQMQRPHPHLFQGGHHPGAGRLVLALHDGGERVPVPPRLAERRVQFQGTVVARQRLGRALQRLQHDAAAGPARGERGVQPHGPIEIVQRLVGGPHVHGDHPERIERHDLVRVDPQHLVEGDRRPGQVAAPLPGQRLRQELVRIGGALAPCRAGRRCCGCCRHGGRADGKVGRTFSPLPALPHGDEGRFQVAAVALGVEKRVAVAMGCQLRPYPLQELPVPG